MFLIKMINFYKAGNCPASQDILSCQNGDMPQQLKKEIDTHISLCDFCGAEAEIYSRYPLSEETPSISDIPIPLLELAESLLNNKRKGNHLLKKMLIENEGLTLKEA